MERLGAGRRGGVGAQCVAGALVAVALLAAGPRARGGARRSAGSPRSASASCTSTTRSGTSTARSSTARRAGSRRSPARPSSAATASSAGGLLRIAGGTVELRRARAVDGLDRRRTPGEDRTATPRSCRARSRSGASSTTRSAVGDFRRARRPPLEPRHPRDHHHPRGPDAAVRISGLSEVYTWCELQAGIRWTFLERSGTTWDAEARHRAHRRGVDLGRPHAVRRAHRGGPRPEARGPAGGSGRPTATSCARTACSSSSPGGRRGTPSAGAT